MCHGGLLQNMLGWFWGNCWDNVFTKFLSEINTELGDVTIQGKGATMTHVSRKRTAEQNSLSLLQWSPPKKIKQKKHRPIFVTSHSAKAEQRKRITRQNDRFELNRIFQPDFSKPPLVSFSRCPTLQDQVVHSSLKSDGQQTWLGSKPRGVL